MLTHFGFALSEVITNAVEHGIEQGRDTTINQIINQINDIDFEHTGNFEILRDDLVSQFQIYSIVIRIITLMVFAWSEFSIDHQVLQNLQ